MGTKGAGVANNCPGEHGLNAFKASTAGIQGEEFAEEGAPAGDGQNPDDRDDGEEGDKV